MAPFSDVLESLGPPPDATAGTAAQFDYVKRSRAAIAAEAVRRINEAKSGARIDPTLVAEHERAKSELERVMAERDEVRRKLAMHDIREDPAFVDTFEAPINDLQAKIIGTIKVVARDDPEALKRDISQALAVTDEGAFRQMVNRIAENVGGYDGSDLRRMVMELREKVRVRNDAVVDFEKTNRRLEDVRARRGQAATQEFRQRHLPMAERSLAASDPLVQNLGDPAMQQVLAPFEPVIRQAMSAIDQAVDGMITATGPLPPAFAEVVAMARARVTERVLLQRALTELSDVNQRHAELVEQFQRLTGRAPTRLQPDQSGPRPPVPPTAQQQPRDPWAERAAASSLVGLAKSRGVV